MNMPNTDNRRQQEDHALWRADITIYEYQALVTSLKERLHVANENKRAISNHLDVTKTELANAEYVAYNVLAELEKHSGADFLLIKDPTIRKWWAENKYV